MEENLVVNNKTIECFCLGTIGLIVAPWKFDVLKNTISASLAIKYSFEEHQISAGQLSADSLIIRPVRASSECVKINYA